MLFLLALEALKDNERVIIEKLYDDYSKRVKELSISILHNDKQADDIVNDTFLKVIRYKDRFLDVAEDEKIRLLIICTRSICFDLYNRSKKLRFESLENFYYNQDEEDTQFDIPSDDDLFRILVDKETSEVVKSAINKLKEPARDMIILKFYYEMKNVEIAEFYKMKNSTVNTIIQRATKKLRKELERYFNDTDK